MNAIIMSIRWHVWSALSSSFALLLLLLVVSGGCRNEQPKVAKVDQANGAVRGTLRTVPEGTMVVLCRVQGTSCTPESNLSDTVNRRGEFAVSKVPPGHYIIAYAFPNDLNQGKLNIKKDDTLSFTFGRDLKVEARMQGGKWRLNEDTSSDTHLIAAGAELALGQSGVNIRNSSVKHKASSLWMEYREGHRYESIEVEANKVAELKLSRWAGD